jgi:Glycosyltransferase 61
MSDTKETLIKDVSILNEVDIVTPEIEFHLIYNDETGRKERAIRTAIPIRVERLVTFVIDSIIPQVKLPLPKINSLRSFAVFIRNLIRNLIGHVSKPVKYDNIVYDFRGHSPNNVAHLMMDIIPSFLHVRSVANQEVYFLLDKVAEPFQKLLDIFNITTINTNNKINASCVKTFTTRGLSAHDRSILFDTTVYALLPNIYDRYSFSSGLEGIDKIFIARRGVRGVSNLSEVEALLKGYGYKTIFMEDYPMEVQLGIATEAKDIIAVHGASMGMLVLNKEIESLIEIMAPNVYNDYFPCAIGSKVKKHIQIMSYFDTRVPYNGWSVIEELKTKEFSVDLGQLEQALKMLN